MIQAPADQQGPGLQQESLLTVHQFPRDMIALLRCHQDAGELAVIKELRGGDLGILDAILSCKSCGAEFRIEDGIACLLPNQLRPEDEHEMSIRDTIDYAFSNPGPFIPPPEGWRSVLSDRLEIPPHLDGLQCSTSNTVLELACGDGRFTTLIAATGARVLAVDFSINALRLLAHRLPPSARVGRVHATINQLQLAGRAFDRALTTTPLDSRDERMTMYRTIAHALTDDGRYVASVEHDDANRRLLGLPLTRRYSRNGILIEHLTAASMRREVAPYFSELRTRPIRPRVPFVAKLPRSLAFPTLRLIAALPIVRQFGELLLLVAERPARLPVEGEYRSGSRVAKNIYKSYMRSKDREPSWGEESV
ncbi:MAG: methyltransferase domain-containing protein [Candidatus Acidiferrum sp.]